MPLLELRQVGMSYGSQRVLSDISFTVDRSETISITGPSGCGKSTLLNLLGGLDRPTAGQVLLEGEDLSSLDETALARLRNRKVGFIFQDHHLLPQCSVLENVLLPALAFGRAAAENLSRAESLLERVGLSDHRHKPPGKLSGGQRQRVAVVRALLNDPPLLLADEPTGALDRATACEIADLLFEINRENGVALILVTHALDLAGRAARRLELRDGKLAQPSPPAS